MPDCGAAPRATADPPHGGSASGLAGTPTVVTGIEGPWLMGKYASQALDMALWSPGVILEVATFAAPNHCDGTDLFKDLQPYSLADTQGLFVEATFCSATSAARVAELAQAFSESMVDKAVLHICHCSRNDCTVVFPVGNGNGRLCHVDSFRLATHGLHLQTHMKQSLSNSLHLNALIS